MLSTRAHRQQPRHQARATRRGTAKKVHVAVDAERAPLLREYLTLNQLGREWIASEADRKASMMAATGSNGVAGVVCPLTTPAVMVSTAVINAERRVIGP